MDSLEKIEHREHTERERERERIIVWGGRSKGKKEEGKKFQHMLDTSMRT